MGIVHIVILIGGMLLFVGIVALAMSHLNHTAIREHERRREEWRAAGMEGPSPGEGLRSSGDGGPGGG